MEQRVEALEKRLFDAQMRLVHKARTVDIDLMLDMNSGDPRGGYPMPAQQAAPETKAYGSHKRTASNGSSTMPMDTGAMDYLDRMMKDEDLINNSSGINKQASGSPDHKR